MANLFFGVQGPTIDLQCNLEIADADAPRIMAYLMQSEHGRVMENIASSVPNPNWTPAPGQTEADRPMIPVQILTTRQASPQEAAENFATATLELLLEATIDLEKQRASAAAAAAILPIIPLGAGTAQAET